MGFKGRHFGYLATGLLLSLTLVLSGHAADFGDHDRARHALEAGEILPLKAVLEKVQRDTPGQVMEVELDHKKERWIYEVKLLRPGGALLTILIDATDGAIITCHGRDIGPKR